MSAEWKAPKFGSPCWIGMPATDVSRAHKFYSEVFNWTWKEANSAEYPPENIRLMDFNPSVQLSGGIQKMPEKLGIQQTGPGGPCIYWLVEDLEKIGEVIEKAGGKMLSETAPEGKFGLYRYFQDTEGTIAGVYQVAPSPE